jgi:hypothetical protein
MISTAALAVSAQHEPIGRHVAEFRSATMELIADYLRRARDSGELAASADPVTLARYFGAVIQGMSVQARDGATADELNALATVAISAWPGPE